MADGNSWKDFCRPNSKVRKLRWTCELEELAGERTRLLGRAREGDDAFSTAAKRLDRIIKRLFRTRRRVSEKQSTTNTAATATPTLKDSTNRLQDLTRETLVRGRPPPQIKPAEYLRHLRSVFCRDPALLRHSLRCTQKFTTP